MSVHRSAENNGSIESKPIQTTFLSEKEIRQLSQAGLQSLPDADSQTDHVRSLIFGLLAAATLSDSGTGYRAATCNLLSTLLLQTSKSQRQHVQNILWQEDAWMSTLDFFIEYYASCKPKPMKQLLNALAIILQANIVRPEALQVHDKLLIKLKTVCDFQGDQPFLKAYLHVLGAFLAKQVVNIHDVFETKKPSHDETDSSTAIDVVLEFIIPLAAFDELGPSLTMLLSTILSLPYIADNQVSWTNSLIKFFTSDPVVQSTYRHYLLPTYLASDFTRLVMLLQSLKYVVNTEKTSIHAASAPTENNLPNQRDELIMTILLCASGMGFVKLVLEGSSASALSELKTLEIPIDDIMALTVTESSQTKICALTLLIGEKPGTISWQKIFTDKFYQLLEMLFADPDPDFRADLTSLLQQFVESIRISGNMALRKDVERVTMCRDVMNQLYTTTMQQLRPGSSYPRHICALKCLSIIARSGMEPSIHAKYWVKSAATRPDFKFKVDLFDAQTRSILSSFLCDAFEDVRSLAADILEMMSDSPQQASNAVDHYLDLLQDMETQAMRSGRADHAYGVARLYRLIYVGSPQETDRLDWLHKLLQSMQTEITLIEENIAQCIERPLIFAIMIGVRFIIETRNLDNKDVNKDSENDQAKAEIFAPLFTSINRAWMAVRPIVCDEAPEGQEFLETEEKDHNASTKDSLSFSWRILQESSLLQRSLVKIYCAVAKDEEKLSQMLSEQLELCFTQLLELRHRGAFSTVAQTFLAICGHVQQSLKNGSAVIQSFYKRTLDLIQDGQITNTRRSAGLPAIIAGLLSSESSESDLIKLAIQDLSNIVQNTLPTKSGESPQIHALNCLREIFKHSRLGTRVEQFIPDALQLTGICLSSDIWGIRNSGLMLFRALLDRLCGTNQSHDDFGQSNRNQNALIRHGSLIKLVLTLFKSTDNAAIDNVERVFPALQLLQLLPPSQEELPLLQVTVTKLLASPHWHVRDKAARTLSRLMRHVDQTVLWVQYDPLTGKSNNERHGRCLFLRYSLETEMSYSTLDLNTLIISCQGMMRDIDLKTQSPANVIIWSAMIDLYRTLVIINHRQCAGKGLEQRPDELTCATNSLRAILADQGHASQAANHLLLRSLVRTMLYEHSVASLWLDLIRSLWKIDPDACVALLEECLVILSKDEIRPLSKDEMRLYRHLYIIAMDLANISSNTKYTRVTLLAIKVIIEVVQHSQDNLKVDMDLPVLQKDSNIQSTPLLHDQALIFIGLGLNSRFLSIQPLLYQFDIDPMDWLMMLRNAIDEDKVYDTRFAAITAINMLMTSFSTLVHDPKHHEFVIGICTLVYDITNDDDDEIRNLASKIAINLIAALKKDVNLCSRNYIPLESGRRLLTALFDYFSSSIDVVSSFVISKFTAAVDTEQLRTGSTLFVKEKQNLYIDLVGEIKLMSGLLCSFEKHDGLEKSLDVLRDWTSEQLHSHEMVSSDQSIAISSDGKMFLRVYKLVKACQVLLYWHERSISSISDDLSKDIKQFLTKMVTQHDSNKKTQYHPMILFEAQSILDTHL